MRLSFDRSADGAYLYLAESFPTGSRSHDCDLQGQIRFVVSSEGKVVAIQFSRASSLLDRSLLTADLGETTLLRLVVDSSADVATIHFPGGPPAVYLRCAMPEFLITKDALGIVVMISVDHASRWFSSVTLEQAEMS